MRPYEAVNGAAPEVELVHHFLERAAELSPDAVAVKDAEECWTYRRLRSHSRRFAALLADRGLRPGARVGVEAVPSRWFTAAAFGALAAGAVLVPLATTLKAPELEYLLSDAEPDLLIADGLPRVAAPVPRIGFDEAAAEASRHGDGAPGPVGIAPDDSALLVYTSGSTAEPKAVECAHSQVVFATDAIGARLRYRSDDVVFTRVPLSFDYGFYQILLSAAAAAAVALVSPREDARLLAAMRKTGATVVPLVPTLADMLLKLARGQRVAGPRLFTNTGEHLPEPTIDALRRHFPEAGLQLMYGLTECKRVTIAEAGAESTRPGTVGRPLDGTVVQIVDSGGDPLPPGASGEITVSGPHVMKGYWRSPELTAERFGRGDEGRRVLRTGDWGRVDADGYLYLEGRRDQLYKSRGVRTSAAEVERAACAVPGVAQAVVLPPAPGRDAVLCVVTELAPQQVLARLRERIEDAKVPRVCEVFASFPHSSNDKIDRSKVAAWVKV